MIIYVALWGFAHLQGRIEEPINEGFKRILRITIILGVLGIFPRKRT
ncbi:type IV secretion system protein [Candidatus Vondammii sp. HM_W22]